MGKILLALAVALVYLVAANGSSPYHYYGPGPKHVTNEKLGVCYEAGNVYIPKYYCLAFLQVDAQNPQNNGVHWCPYNTVFDIYTCTCNHAWAVDYCPDHTYLYSEYEQYYTKYHNTEIKH